MSDIELSVSEIQETMLTGGLSPHSMAEYRVILSAHHSRLDELLITILSRKPTIWNTLRPNLKSDTAANRAYEATEDGLEEMKLRHQMKNITLMIGALSSMLRVKESEAKNQF